MGIPRLYKTEAIVLKRSDLGEADRIVTLYTPQFGKIRVVAKGVRKTTSRLAGHVELFSRASLLIARGKNLDIVTQGQTIDCFLSLRDDLLKTSYALFITEIIDRFTEERIENYPLYRLLIDTLACLGTGNRTDQTLFYFEMRLLQFTGYRPELRQCVGCRVDLAPVTNFFSAASGGMLCPSCARSDSLGRPLTVKALKVLRFLQESERAEVQRLKLEDSLVADIEALLRSYVRHILERDLRSTQFLDLLKKGAAS